VVSVSAATSGARRRGRLSARARPHAGSHAAFHGLAAMGTATGTLPYLLLLLTVVAGAVDAVSFLSLGHVFVVNMTGNIVFLGFAAAGVTEISLTSTLIALGAFVCGSVAGGRLALRFAEERLLAVATVVKIVLIAVALIVVAASHESLDALQRETAIALLAFAMGVQNASARRIGIPDLTTTVLTMTLTAFAADSSLAGGTNPRWNWNRRRARPRAGVARRDGTARAIRISRGRQDRRLKRSASRRAERGGCRGRRRAGRGRRSPA